MSDHNSYQIKHIKVNFKDHTVTSNGVEMAIDFKAVEVLKLLITHANKTVTTDMFMDQVWQDKPSSPEVVPAAIARLRKLFKLAGIDSDLIVTVHKVGYRFKPLSEESNEKNQQRPHRKSWLKPAVYIVILAGLFFSFGVYFKHLYDPPITAKKNHKNITEINQESQSPVTQIYVLRHTEKVDATSEDPALSVAGIARAKYWKKVLQHIEFEQVFTTNFKRNIQTAELISESSSVKPELYYPLSFDVLKFINLIKGQKVLVIGHSNTIPDMVNRLIGETRYPPMSHENYNVLYIINIYENGDTNTSKLYIEMPQTVQQ